MPDRNISDSPPQTIDSHIYWDPTLVTSLVSLNIGGRLRSVERSTRFVRETHLLTHIQTDFMICSMLLMHNGQIIKRILIKLCRWKLGDLLIRWLTVSMHIATVQSQNITQRKSLNHHITCISPVKQQNVYITKQNKLTFICVTNTITAVTHCTCIRQSSISHWSRFACCNAAKCNSRAPYALLLQFPSLAECIQTPTPIITCSA